MNPTILAFETSCDETAVAVVRGTEPLSNVLSSQVDLHARFGGVVPEVAARAHVESIRSLTHKALSDAGVHPDDLDGVAATAGPGLVGALLVGHSFAKATAWARQLPFVGIDHMEVIARGRFTHGTRTDFDFIPGSTHNAGFGLAVALADGETGESLPLANDRGIERVTGSRTTLAAGVRVLVQVHLRPQSLAWGGHVGGGGRAGDGCVGVEHESGDTLVVSVIDAVDGVVRAVHVGKPTLADVFIQRTGRRLDRENENGEHA